MAKEKMSLEASLEATEDLHAERAQDHARQVDEVLKLLEVRERLRRGARKKEEREAKERQGNIRTGTTRRDRF